MGIVTVRVMPRESVGRPVRGDRSKLAAFTYAVAEYHGNRCYEVITGTDSLTTAVRLADQRASVIGGMAEYMLRKKPVARKRSKPKAVVVAKPSRFKAPGRKPGSAGAQNLHMRDIRMTGTCQSCGGGVLALSVTCGSKAVALVESVTAESTPVVVPEAPKPETSKPKLTFADVMAATAHLRGE